MYDEARARQGGSSFQPIRDETVLGADLSPPLTGATLHLYSDPPFDIILLNNKNEVSETNIAFRFLNLGADSPLITPASPCGLAGGRETRRATRDW